MAEQEAETVELEIDHSEVYVHQVGYEVLNYRCAVFGEVEELVQNDSRIYSGFIRNDDTLERKYPTHLLVNPHSLDAFSVPVDEFFRVVDSDVHAFSSDDNLFNDEVYVVCNWKWGIEDETGSFPSIVQEHCVLSSDTEGDDISEGEVDDGEELHHTVVFKCIGSNKDSRSQVIIQQVSMKRNLGEVVQVKLKPEPLNPYDARAIGFICLDNGREYECLDAVHYAIYLTIRS